MTIDPRDNAPTLSGDSLLSDAAGEDPVSLDSKPGKTYRKFELSEVVDLEKISAALNDGALHLSLPQVAKATPRNIEVSAG